MFLTKRIKKLLGLFLLLSGIALSSCTIYKTLNVDPVTSERLEATNSTKEIVIIHDDSEKSEYVLALFTVENDSVKGVVTLPPPGRTHYPHQPRFRHNRVKAYHHPKSTMHIFTSLENIVPGSFGMPISSIKTVEIHDKNIGASILSSFGVVIGTSVVATAGILAIVCACPEVETYNADGSQYHGSLFPGAIFKSLKRGDFLILENLLLTESGDLNLRVSNMLPETQYIDQLEVLEVQHPGYKNLGLSNENKLVAYNQPQSFVLANGSSDEDITHALEKGDGLHYNFNDFSSHEELNSLSLKFDRSAFSDNPVLVIRGKQTQWLDTVANYIYYKGGRSHDNWLRRKDNSSASKWMDNSMKRGLSLNVYLKENGDWAYVGTHHNVGTVSMRDLVMALDLQRVKSSDIEIKLESAFRIWEIDYVGLSDDWNANLRINTLDLVAANNHSGEDVSKKISGTDEDYLIQDEKGTFVELQVKAPAVEPFSTLVLFGSGYYHQETDYENKLDRMFFVRLRNKMGIHDVSQALYLYKTIQ